MEGYGGAFIECAALRGSRFRGLGAPLRREANVVIVAYGAEGGQRRRFAALGNTDVSRSGSGRRRERNSIAFIRLLCSDSPAPALSPID